MRITWLFLLPSLAQPQNYLRFPVAGGGPPPTPVASAQAAIDPTALIADPIGNLYFIADNCVFKLDRTGQITRVAGSSELPGFSGDGGPATGAQLAHPQALAVDRDGNLYIADTGNARVRRVALNGAITTVAGNGNSAAPAGDGPEAINASVGSPAGLAVDASGNLYISDAANGRIRRVSPAGAIATIAGQRSSPDIQATCATGGLGDGMSAIEALLCAPAGLAVDSAGNLYIGSTLSKTVRRISGGTITTVAGLPSGSACSPWADDGAWAVQAHLCQPRRLALDSAGNLHISDFGHRRVFKVLPDGRIQTAAGNGQSDYSGDGASALAAALCDPQGVAFDSAGNLNIAGCRRIRKVVSGIIATAAGTGESYTSGGDGGLATSAVLNQPAGVAVDRSGSLYIADTRNSRVRKISAGIVTTVAGNGADGFSGDGGPATAAQLHWPQGLALDSNDNLYVADSMNRRIRKVSATAGAISTIAGSGTSGSSGDGGPAAAAQFKLPVGLAFDPAGNLFVSDALDHRVRRISTTRTITTFAGTGVAGYSGDNTSATAAAQLSSPQAIAADSLGNLYIADQGNNRVREVTPGGTITTVAGNGLSGDTGDAGPGASAQVGSPRGVALDLSGTLFLGTLAGRLRAVSPDGIIRTLGPLEQPFLLGGIAVDNLGNLYYSDFDRNVVWAAVPPHTNPVLQATLRAQGAFQAGQSTATYSIVVSNAGLAGPTRGPITVTELVPPSLTIVSMAGPGWSCSPPSCTRNDVLFPGTTYNAITVTVSVSPAAPAQILNQVTVSGGGAITATAADLVNVARATSLAPSLNSVLHGAGFTPTIAPNSFVSLFGANFSAWTGNWDAAISGGLLPTELGNVKVRINGRDCFVNYASANQVNILTPHDTATGSVAVEVITPNGNAASTAILAPVAPGFFGYTLEGKFRLAALFANTATYVAPAGSLSGVSARPAAAGEYLQLYATGLGATNPQAPLGRVLSQAYPIDDPSRLQLTIGGKPVPVLWAGLTYAGLFQVNIQVPPGLGSGDLPVVLTVNGLRTQDNAYLTLQ